MSDLDDDLRVRTKNLLKFKVIMDRTPSSLPPSEDPSQNQEQVNQDALGIEDGQRENIDFESPDERLATSHRSFDEYFDDDQVHYSEDLLDQQVAEPLSEGHAAEPEGGGDWVAEPAGDFIEANPTSQSRVNNILPLDDSKAKEIPQPDANQERKNYDQIDQTRLQEQNDYDEFLDDPSGVNVAELIDFRDLEGIADLEGTYELNYVQFRNLHLKKKLQLAEAKRQLEDQMLYSCETKPLKMRQEYLTVLEDIDELLEPYTTFRNFKMMSEDEQAQSMMAKALERAKALAEVEKQKKQKEGKEAKRARRKKGHAQISSKPEAPESSDRDRIAQATNTQLSKKDASCFPGYDPRIRSNESTIFSELSSNRSHQFNRERSRQVYCQIATKNIIHNVSEFRRQMDDETYQLAYLENGPLAVKFVDKVLRRVQRMMNGEMLGSMIESELEELEVDSDFEDQRRMMEIATTENNCSDSGMNKMALNLQENFSESGQTPGRFNESRGSKLKSVNQAIRTERLSKHRQTIQDQRQNSVLTPAADDGAQKFRAPSQIDQASNDNQQLLGSIKASTINQQQSAKGSKRPERAIVISSSSAADLDDLHQSILTGIQTRQPDNSGAARLSYEAQILQLEIVPQSSKAVPEGPGTDQVFSNERSKGSSAQATNNPIYSIWPAQQQSNMESPMEMDKNQQYKLHQSQQANQAETDIKKNKERLFSANSSNRAEPFYVEYSDQFNILSKNGEQASKTRTVKSGQKNNIGIGLLNGQRGDDYIQEEDVKAENNNEKDRNAKGLSRNESQKEIRKVRTKQSQDSSEIEITEDNDPTLDENNKKWVGEQQDEKERSSSKDPIDLRFKPASGYLRDEANLDRPRDSRNADSNGNSKTTEPNIATGDRRVEGALDNPEGQIEQTDQIIYEEEVIQQESKEPSAREPEAQNQDIYQPIQNQQIKEVSEDYPPTLREDQNQAYPPQSQFQQSVYIKQDTMPEPKDLVDFNKQQLLVQKQARSTSGMREPMIDVDKSYQIVSDLKKQFYMEDGKREASNQSKVSKNSQKSSDKDKDSPLLQDHL